MDMWDNGGNSQVQNVWGRKLHRLRFPETLFRRLLSTVIVFLCIYVAAKCINIISGGSAKEVVVKTGSYSGNVLARELIENSDVVDQYMFYIENNKDLTEYAKKELLKSVVTDYIEASEYTYDTTDPGYNQVIHLIYENINASDQTSETETEPLETKAKPVSKPNKEKTIVPMPKSIGKIYNAGNIGSFKNLIDKFYTITTATDVYESDLPVAKALKEDFKITGKNNKPQILIYHTHSQEEFCDSTTDPDTTIIGVGNHLAKILKKQFGYNVIHDTTTYDIVNGKLDRNEAYDQSRAGVKRLLKKYPSISLVLDIHRDGVGNGTRLVTEINEKKTAQIMFFNGMSRFKISGDIDYLYNPYRYESLALTLQMKLAAERYYPGYTRRNYVNAYQYNLDICRQCMLIEIGAQTNTIEEAKNAAEPLAVLIDKVLGKNKRY